MEKEAHTPTPEQKSTLDATPEQQLTPDPSKIKSVGKKVADLAATHLPEVLSQLDSAPEQPLTSSSETSQPAPSEVVSDPDRPLSLEEIADFNRRLSAEAKARAPKEALFQAKQLGALERQFRAQLNRSKQRGLPAVPETEFKLWEKEYSEIYKNFRREVYRGELSSTQESRAASPMFISTDPVELENTVEAQSAQLFSSRQSDLIRAIHAAGGSEDELRYARSFYKTVDRHLDYRYMPDDESSDYGSREYDEARTFSHDSVIRHLNGLNALAEKYHTERFTPRDFITSDAIPRGNHTPDVKERILCDRNTVAAYYTIAFRSEVDRRQEQWERERARYR